MKLHALTLLALLSLIPAPVIAETVRIEAGRDATLIEHPDGARANGSGPFFFVGRTSQGQNSVRRTLIWFDVAAALDRLLASLARDIDCAFPVTNGRE